MAGEYYIPRPHPGIFAHRDEDPTVAVIRENRTQFVIDRIEYVDHQGIMVWYKDTPFPRRGFPTPEAVVAVNTVKRAFIELVRTLGMWQFWPGFVLAMLTSHERKARADRPADVVDYGERRQPVAEKLLRSFNRVCWPVVSGFVIRPSLMTPLASELQGLLFATMARAGVDREVSKTFATVVGTLIEYDNAYRYRLEDVFTETNMARLHNNPGREIARLVKLYCSREKDWGVAVKFKTVHLLARPLFWSKRVKAAFRKALEGCDFERLQFDDIDRYWANVRLDYDFFGKGYQERMKGHTPVPGYQLTI